MVLADVWASSHPLCLSGDLRGSQREEQHQNCLAGWWDFPCGPEVKIHLPIQGHEFDPWSREIPHASGQLSPCAVLCLVTQSGLTLCDPMDCSPPGSSVYGDSPGKNTGVGCHFLLQGIVPTQESNPGLLHCRQILYQLSYQGSPFHLMVLANVTLSS